ncbi:cytochrome P450 [Paxillus ammoniavirescens]|nr:cytochrome P450 [Paxillus ammoniavirescens]
MSKIMKIQPLSLAGWQVASVVLACITSGGLLWARRRLRRKQRLPLPPGPSASPHGKHSPQQVQQWIEEYGPIITLTNGKDIHVVIGRHHEAVMLMEKQGAVLADRPYSIASNEILSRGLKFMQMSTCDRFRKYRKAAHAELQMKATLIYDNEQAQYARNIVLDILKDPASHQGHIKRFSATVTLRVIYGKTTPTYVDDPYILHLQRMVPIVQGALMPGAYKVDKYPFLKYVPGYTRGLDKWADLEHEQFTNNVRQTKIGLENHTGPHSVAGGLLSKPEMGMSENEIAYFCGSLVGASFDTTQVAISTILMAAAHFPEIQEIVQAEIDSAVGREIAPSLENWCTLTKLHAFILEALRWRPVNPLGVPHRAAKDVIWNGYCIPANAIVSGNHWCVSRDPEVFPDPERFDINRWIDEDGNLNDLKAYSFGFGRRICPGLNLANRAMFIAVATIMWAFTIKEDLSNRYNAFELPAAIVSHHKPYSILYEPRTDVEWLKEVMSGQTSKSDA